MTESVRRVVTGQTAEGTSVFASDTEIQPTDHGGRQLYPVWGTDEIPVRLPTDGSVDYAATRFPPPHGARVLIVTYPASDEAPISTPGVAAAGGVPTDGGRYESNDPATGQHMTNTIDVVLIIKGEIGLEQDNGVEVVLREGDVLVQNGARHAWRTRGVECRVAFFILGAERG
ncbi:MAG TPA: cupin domain-containing protein [Mycobacteriales bacterium]|jgi:hypothetical protein|nr:cupin domain-containing protein [Mycobacteriales bacterium]